MRVVALYSLGFIILWLFGGHSAQGGIQGVDGCYVEDGKSGTDRPREPQTMNSDLEHGFV